LACADHTLVELDLTNVRTVDAGERRLAVT